MEARIEEHLQLPWAAANEREEEVFDGAKFEHSDEDKFERLVRELAIEDVMAQKAYYETSLGIGLRAIELAAHNASIEETTTANAAITHSFDEVDYRISATVILEIVDSN